MNDHGVDPLIPSPGGLSATAPSFGNSSYELFGLGWRPPTAQAEYIGRHRAPDS